MSIAVYSVIKTKRRISDHVVVLFHESTTIFHSLTYVSRHLAHTISSRNAVVSFSSLINWNHLKQRHCSASLTSFPSSPGSPSTNYVHESRCLVCVSSRLLRPLEKLTEHSGQHRLLASRSVAFNFPRVFSNRLLDTRALQCLCCCWYFSRAMVK